MNRCKAVKPNGERCSRIASIDSEYCWQHQNQRKWTLGRMLAGITLGGIVLALLAGIGLYSDLLGLGVPLPFYSASEQVVDVLEISRVKPINNAPTVISSGFTVSNTEVISTVVVSHHWQMFLSNNGETAMSIVDYELVRIEDEESAVLQYSDMDQGLWALDETGELKPVDFPLYFEPGESKEIFVRVGIFAHPDAYKILRKSNPLNSKESLLEITDTLRKNGLDIFGNQLEEMEGVVYRYPAIDEMKDEYFGIEFFTSRNATASRVISWYKYGGMYDDLYSQ